MLHQNNSNRQLFTIDDDESNNDGALGLLDTPVTDDNSHRSRINYGNQNDVRTNDVITTRGRPKSLMLDTSIARHSHVTKKLRTLSLMLTHSSRHRRPPAVSTCQQYATRRCHGYQLHNNPLYGMLSIYA